MGLGSKYAINGNLVIILHLTLKLITISPILLLLFFKHFFFRKPVYLLAYNETVIRHLVVDTEIDGNYWKVNVDVYFENNNRNVVNGTLVISTIFNPYLTRTVNLKPNQYGELVYTTTFLVYGVSNFQT